VASLLTICLQITSGSNFVHISGVPGAGKTHAMVMLQLTFSACFDWPIIWVAEGNCPLDSAAFTLEEITKDIPTLRAGIKRFPARLHELVQNDLVCTYRERLKAVGETRTALITCGSFSADLLRGWSPLSGLKPAKIGIVDESQGFWTPAQAAFFTTLHPQAIVICTGDAQQPAGAASNMLEQFLLRHAVARGAGSHSRRIRYATPATVAKEEAQYIMQQDSKHDHWSTHTPSCGQVAQALAAGLKFDRDSTPATLEDQVGQSERSPCHLLLAGSQRLNPLSYLCLISGGLYPEALAGSKQNGTLVLGSVPQRVLQLTTQGEGQFRAVTLLSAGSE